MKLLSKSRDREDTVSDSEEDSDFTNAFHRIAVNNGASHTVSYHIVLLSSTSVESLLCSLVKCYTCLVVT